MRDSPQGKMFEESNSLQRQTFGNLMHSASPDDDFSFRNSASSAPSPAHNGDASPYTGTWEGASSPYTKSPWSSHEVPPSNGNHYPNGLMGSLVREEGHIYSLATSGDLLYTGSDSKNIRVWKNQKEFSGFKSNSGLVKAIIISGEKIFTGHQDGKIRVWKVSAKNPSVHKRVGTLPSFKDYIKCSMNPSNYVEVRRHRNALWIKHFDAISSLSLSEDKKFLYSASWDKTIKVWRISDSKCLESVNVHDDAVNAVVAGFDGLVFTGSADGTVKVWRRELQAKGTKHFFSQTLLKQECAVTALAVNPEATFLYCGSSDGIVNFWEREKHLSHGGILRGHKLAVLCLVAAGNLVFSGSADMGICVWRRLEGGHSCLAVLTGHNGPVKCLAIEEDIESTAEDRRWILYSGSLDKSVKMWRVSELAPPWQQIDSIQRRQIEGLSSPSPSPSTQSFSPQGKTSQNRR
ncbi:hypothetical protein PVL29_026480 [Vitis rotundifolia]|uniref:Uncharacterized protein n=1 Tax=Vitis rotundifolia TaxID=103349 RepID=A0AA39D416_VITRO|nr:hypothetical protein PVL29_026480 [Vitis rotundifolia]